MLVRIASLSGMPVNYVRVKYSRVIVGTLSALGRQTSVGPSRSVPTINPRMAVFWIDKNGLPAYRSLWVVRIRGPLPFAFFRGNGARIMTTHSDR